MRENDARKLSDAERTERRRQILACLRSGMGPTATAKLCGVCFNTVKTVKQLHEEGGMKALKSEQTGRPIGKGRILTSEQEREAQKIIADKTPDQLKMPFALWNREAVREMIARRYERKLSVRAVGDYLKRWGFTAQKPLKKAYEQRPAEVERWKEEVYPAIKARAAKEGADIHWGDETGLRSDDVRGRSYSPKGRTPVIRVNQNRHSCSVMSTVTNKGKMRWMVFGGAMNSKRFIDFLRRLIKGEKRKLFLVLDNLRVHHSKPVKEWVKKNSEAIELFFLPSYSPELNPVELANADLKQAVTKREPARKKGRLEKVVSSHLRSLQATPNRIIKFFHKDTVHYAA